MRKGSILYSLLHIAGKGWGVVLMTLLITTGCAKRGPDDWLLKDPAYKGWQVVSYKNVRIYFAPGHPQTARMEATAQKYEMAIRSMSQILKLPAPTDTLKVVYYTGLGQAREMTGQTFPFADSLGVLRFWLPFAPGVPAAQLYIRKWDPISPKHQFLWHGLVSLLDFQGEDYHATTIEYSHDTVWVPLARLAVDTTINSNNERYQSAEAASFCAYVLGNYGLDRLTGLYDSQLPFDQTVQEVLGISVDSAQVEWLMYAHLASPKYRDKATQSDSSAQKR
jgi:hypothetical protein